jgi:histidinol-phosphate aminotransferase
MVTACTMPLRIHGGSDAMGPARFDFSTNANACGPCPQALAAVQSADLAQYPDPAYVALRAQLAQWHGVVPERVVLAESASAFIFRITAWCARHGLAGRQPVVGVPQHAYGDYAHAAQAAGLRAEPVAENACLYWLCDPSSPLGAPADALPDSAQDAPCVWDRAYAPLRLAEGLSPDVAFPAPAWGAWRAWQLFSPNKVLGLTGVRAAYALAPDGAQAMVQALECMTPSWPLGAHGVAMLQAWATPAVQTWCAASRATLQDWKSLQIAMLEGLGWQCHPSLTHFFCARPPAGTDLPQLLERLRAQGIKLRDATSFGLPGWVRLRVHTPAAQAALASVLRWA